MQNVDRSILANLLKQLPGEDAQHLMAPLGRKEYANRIEHYTDSAVIILLVPTDNGVIFPLIKRSSKNPNDKHAGQISLPGGKKDQADKDIIHTALRELEEEIGIPTDQVDVVGALSSLKVPVSGFIIHPFVGIYLPEDAPKYIKQISEVDEILEVGVSDLIDQRNVLLKNIPMASGMVINDVPYFNLSSKVVWGATAMILSEMKELLKNYRN